MKNNFTTPIYQCIKLAFFGVLLVCFCACSRSSSTLPTPLQTAANMMWQDADSALVLFDKIDTTTLSDIDHKYYKMQRNLLVRMINYDIRPNAFTDTVINDYLPLFHAAGNTRYEAEACYFIASNYLFRDKGTQANLYLKQAETLMQSLSLPPVEQGMIYYKLGRSANAAMMFDAAIVYYHKALPHFEDTNNQYALENKALIICTLGQIYYIQEDYAKADSCVQVLDSILPLIQDKKTATLVQYHRLNCQPLENCNELVRLGEILCDTFGYYTYAVTNAEVYTARENFEKARYWLDKSEEYKDELPDYDSFRYSLILSEYYYRKGSHQEAYVMLYNTIHEQMDSVYANNRNYNFEVSRQFDVQTEQHKLELMEQHKQRQRLIYITSFVGTACLVLLLFSCLLFYRQHTLRKQNALLVKQSALTKEIEEKRTLLRKYLSKRIILSKEISFATQEDWQAFKVEFNASYYNCLERWQAAFPDLSMQDLQVLSLIVLDFTTDEICLLLKAQKRTIYNRRQTIRTRIKLPENLTLEQWINQELDHLSCTNK